ncbi:MAG: 3-hydroxyacyl-CoA dehydrogenase family protein [Bacteroidota bacterium]
MEYTERLRKVSVLGGAGKMGSGILLLTALEMADLVLQDKNRKMELWAIDLSPESLRGLMKYLESQVLKAAEKKMVWLRKMYAGRPDLIENGDIVAAYVDEVVGLINTSTHLSDAGGSTLIFEAIKEDPAVKIPVLQELYRLGEGKTWFFTNTSSIPISRLDKEAGLDGSIIGFHFYNPPAVQKLVELIPGSRTRPELIGFAKTYAKNLKKTVVPSNDFAGFIGNGHFMRDALYAIEETERMTGTIPVQQAIWTINRVSQEFLLRPMGIFQLIDYVGIDVVVYIMQVMNPFLPDENLDSPFLKKLLGKGIRGGQFSDGSQKDGFFRYEKGKPVAIINPETGGYDPLEPVHKATLDTIGNPPLPLTWREVNFAADKAGQLDGYFATLRSMDTYGAKLALTYGRTSRKIGELLVRSGVANSPDDVNKVLETGFYHAYGPVNEYFN